MTDLRYAGPSLYGGPESRVNGATKLKIYSYIDIGKYLCVCQFFFARWPPEAHGPYCKFGTPLYLGKYKSKKV